MPEQLDSMIKELCQMTSQNRADLPESTAELRRWASSIYFTSEDDAVSMKGLDVARLLTVKMMQDAVTD